MELSAPEGTPPSHDNARNNAQDNAQANARNIGQDSGQRLGASVTLAELESNPHPLLARLRTANPACWVPALQAWLITSRELAVRVMNDADGFTVDDPRFSTAQIIGPSMLSRDAPEHVRHRRPFAAAFRPAEVRRRFNAIVAAETDLLIQAMRAAGGPGTNSGDVRADLAGPLSVAVVAAALGLRDAEPDQILWWYRDIVAGVTALSAGKPAPPASALAFAALRSHIEQALTDGDDHSLLVAASAGGLETAAVVSNAAVLMFGGIETTDGMISNAAYHLLHHRQELDLVVQNPDLLPAAVTESLRLEPAAATIDRYATHDVVLGQSHINRGDLVVVSLAGANRDPTVFADPDRFDLHRSNADMQLAFVQGPHFCLGEHLARLETHTALGALLQLPGLHADPEDDCPPRGLVFRKPDRVAVRWDDAAAGHPRAGAPHA